MDLIKKYQAPEYLSDEDDKDISVPNNTLKMDTKVKNKEDLKHLIYSIRYWGVGGISKEVCSYCFHDGSSDLIEVLELFRKDFHYIEVLIQSLSLQADMRVRIIVESCIFELVTMFQAECCARKDSCWLAAAAGHVQILQYHLHRSCVPRSYSLSEVPARTRLCVGCFYCTGSYE